MQEILNEPDGDYGCAYLLKRHPESVVTVPMDSHGILIDIDEPKDYQRFLTKSYDAKDPVEEFYNKTSELRREGKSFAIATIIEVIGSASARTGSKAIINQEGKNLLGWVGGGCAERFIGEESGAAITEGKTRIVLADMDDEIFGLGVACGGKMRVFIDPIIPAETVYLPESAKFQKEIRSLSSFYGWNVKKDFSVPSPETVEELLLLMTRTLAKKRGHSGESLREVKNVPAVFLPTNNGLMKKEVTIVGRTRITEALARHFSLLSYSIRAIGPDLRSEDYPSNIQCQCLDEGYGEIEFKPGEVVIIASHTSQDPALVEKALKQEASHVAMIGSYKRSLEVLNHLKLLDEEINYPLFVPAGLDLDARNPDEIALSVVAEVILKTQRTL
jgi:xanthine/CO dehydrogenase XdhC/CoxF family maturation factor